MAVLSPHRAIVCVLLSLVILCTAGVSGAAAGEGSPTTQYPVPGSPYQVAVETPERVWATLPAQNAIVRLTVTSSGVYDVATFVLPVANSEPYAIAYTAGKVWFTERLGNRIGSLDAASDPATPGWMEYSVDNTPNSEPTGIAVVAGTPLEVWFAERSGNKLGRLRVDSGGSATMDEYPLPVADAYPESVSALATEPIWFSAPGVSEIYRFRVSLWPWSPDAFASVPTGSGSLPWGIKVNLDGRPWVADSSGNRIGKYIAGTFAYFAWSVLPVPGSEPYGMDIAQGVIWFTEKSGNRVGQLRDTTGAVLEQALPGATPTGISVDAAGCAWVAANGENALIRWCPPHLYLPLIMKGY
jgi:virginiamycin B lyase